MEKLVEKGYRINCYERCALTLPGDIGEPTKGIVMLEVDDVLEFGDEDHRSLMESLEQEIKFGKRVKLRESNEGIFFAGRRLRQRGD